MGSKTIKTKIDNTLANELEQRAHGMHLLIHEYCSLVITNSLLSENSEKVTSNSLQD